MIRNGQVKIFNLFSRDCICAALLCEEKKNEGLRKTFARCLVSPIYLRKTRCFIQWSNTILSVFVSILTLILNPRRLPLQFRCEKLSDSTSGFVNCRVSPVVWLASTGSLKLAIPRCEWKGSEVSSQDEGRHEDVAAGNLRSRSWRWANGESSFQKRKKKSNLSISSSG